MRGIELQPFDKFIRTTGSGRRPKGAETALMGRKEKILHGACRRAEFIEHGDFAIRFDPGSDGDNNRGLLTVRIKFVPLFPTDLIGRSDPVIDGHQRLPQSPAGISNEHMEAPWLRQTVRRRPICILEDFQEKPRVNLTAAFHHVRFDRAAGTKWQLRRHAFRFQPIAKGFKGKS